MKKLHIAELVLAVFLSGSVFFACTKKPETLPASLERSEKREDVYTCPMHPEVKSHEPGKCPICHMPLVKVKSGASNVPMPEAKEKPDQKKVKFYRHPMNPTITSKVPAKDDMGMDYIPVYEEKSAPSANGVPGRGEVSLEATELKQAGMRLIPIELQDKNYEIEAPGRALGGSEISMQVFESDLFYIKAGLKVIARSPLFPDRTIEGRITSIDSFLDPSTRTVRVGAALFGQVHLKSESSLTARILVPMNQKIFIPESAVVHTGKQDLVFVYTEKGSFQPRAVFLGIKSNGLYEVKEGLRVGTKIASGPNFLMDSESRIRGVHSPD